MTMGQERPSDSADRFDAWWQQVTGEFGRTDDSYREGGPAAAPAFLSDPLLYDGVRFKRVIAYVIDLCILGVIFVLAWFTGGIVSLLTFGLATPLVILLTALLPFLYHTLLLASPGHATVGMRMMGIRMVAWNGQNPGLIQAGLQTILFYVSIGMTQGLILLVALFNGRARCLHDLLCGTLIVNEFTFHQQARLQGPAQSGVTYYPPER